MIRVLLISLVSLTAVFARAADPSSGAVSTERPAAPRQGPSGVRVSLLRPILDMEAVIRASGREVTLKNNIDDTKGIAVGYAHIPTRGFGLMSQLAGLRLQNNGQSDYLELVRLDANLTYSFARWIYVRGGPNLSKFIHGEGAPEYSPMVGGQLGAGLQLTPNWGFDVAAIRMKQTRSESGVTADLTEMGTEFALTGTF